MAEHQEHSGSTGSVAAASVGAADVGVASVGAAGASAARSGARSGGFMRRSDLLRYAQDNRFVRAVDDFTTGPLRPLFLCLIVLAVGVGIYFPVRDLYIAYRSQNILEQQLAIRTAYNETLEDEVSQLLSKEGVQDLARKELGMVMEGETAVNVTGVEESDDGDEDSEPSTSAEVDAAEAAVYENSAWYWQVLDTIFFFDGTSGQAVVSTGETEE